MSNYTAEETAKIVNTYLIATNKKLAIAELSETLVRSEKSIIGKLAREGVYEKNRYLNKRGEVPETKKEIIARLADLCNLNPARIQGLEKSPKNELKLLEQALMNALNPVEITQN